MSELQAVKDKIVCIPFVMAEEETVTEGGIILSSEVVERINKIPHVMMEIVSIGDECSGDLKVGDVIYTHPNSGQEISLQENQYKVLNHAEVYCRQSRKDE